MKAATGKYVGVRAVTRGEAIELARVLFSDGAEGYKLWAEGAKLWAESDQLRAEGYKLWAEGYKLWAEGDKLGAEGDKLWAELAISQMGFSPDWRALNLIAADLDNAVYCFVFTLKELWIYDGEICPDAEIVEKIQWGCA